MIPGNVISLPLNDVDTFFLINSYK
ncbi:hypothetical protein H206_03300, partial [Candidatus Electrothrix aarhusensis]